MEEFKKGDKVRFKDWNIEDEFIVHTVHSSLNVSLASADCPEIEEYYNVATKDLQRLGPAWEIKKLQEIEIMNNGSIMVGQPTRKELRAKINELIDAVNKLNKEKNDGPNREGNR
jgi:hypothetical protein